MLFISRAFLVPALALVLAGCSTAAPAPDPATPAVAADPPAPGPAGAASISAADLRAHVEILAADDYAGRGTLEPGADKARDYLAARFASYGLAPMPGRDSLVVPYTLHEHGYDRETTVVELTVGGETRVLAAGADFTPFYFSTDDQAAAELVFAGYGITAPDLDYDDYAGLDVKGKLVVVLRYTPDHGKDSDRFAGSNHSYFQVKAKNAYDRGAAGMILATGPAHAEGADDLRIAGMLQLPPGAEDKSGDPRGAAAGAKPENKEEERPFVAVHVSADAFGWLFERSGVASNLAAVQAKLDAGGAARKLALREASARITVKRDAEPRPVHPANVVGFLEGSDPELKDEWVVIGGHYDHLGAFTGHGDTIYNGADDNASGTAGILELAQAFASLPERPKRSIAFIAFSGEERGLLGSRAMLAEEQLPVDRIALMINLDMIGRNPERPIEVVGDAFGSNVRAVTEAANADVGLDLEFGGTNYSGASDHHPFYQRDVPFMFFFTGTHEDYHQLSDHPDKLSYDRMEKIVRVAYGVAERMAAGERPRFVHNVLWLGVAIEVQGAGDEQRAVVTAVEPGSRAGKAGLTTGDIVRGFDGTPLAVATDIGARFRDLEPGTRFRLAIERAGEVSDLDLERARPGYLGIMPRPVTDDDRKRHGLGETEGILIAQVVPDGPAAKAGFADNDILIRIAGLPVGLRDLTRTLSRIGAGEKVTVTVIRNAKRLDLEMVLGERP